MYIHVYNIHVDIDVMSTFATLSLVRLCAYSLQIYARECKCMYT